MGRTKSGAVTPAQLRPLRLVPEPATRGLDAILASLAAIAPLTDQDLGLLRREFTHLLAAVAGESRPSRT
jgi:hypothetical protein